MEYLVPQVCDGCGRTLKCLEEHKWSVSCYDHIYHRDCEFNTACEKCAANKEWLTGDAECLFCVHTRRMRHTTLRCLPGAKEDAITQIKEADTGVPFDSVVDKVCLKMIYTSGRHHRMHLLIAHTIFTAIRPYVVFSTGKLVYNAFGKQLYDLCARIDRETVDLRTVPGLDMTRAIQVLSRRKRYVMLRTTVITRARMVNSVHVRDKKSLREALRRIPVQGLLLSETKLLECYDGVFADLAALEAENYVQLVQLDADCCILRHPS